MGNVVTTIGYRSPMRTALLAAIATVSLLASCSSDESATDTTAAAVETTQAADTTEAATESTITRDAVLAVRRCLDEANITLPLKLNMDGVSAADTASELCKEARAQVDVDNTGSKAVTDLSLAIGALNLTLANAALQVALNGELSDAEFNTMMDDLLQHAEDIDALLSAVS